MHTVHSAQLMISVTQKRRDEEHRTQGYIGTGAAANIRRGESQGFGSKVIVGTESSVVQCYALLANFSDSLVDAQLDLLKTGLPFFLIRYAVAK